MKTTALLIILFLTGFSQGLLACSCIGQRTVKEELKHTDAVITGTILSKQLIVLAESALLEKFPVDTSSEDASEGQLMIARYDLLVEAVYKGNIIKDTVVIYTGIGGGDCGVEFEVGKKYIVYGEKETDLGMAYKYYPYPKGKNIIWTNRCSRTSFFDQEEITELEQFAKKRRVRKKKL